jgi:hypothetical protein
MRLFQAGVDIAVRHRLGGIIHVTFGALRHRLDSDR